MIQEMKFNIYQILILQRKLKVLLLFTFRLFLIKQIPLSYLLFHGKKINLDMVKII